MTVTNSQSGTTIDEVADGIFRICTPVAIPGGGFSFNQYLIVDDEPLLFHTGLRKLFPLVREAAATVLAPERLRYIAFSHTKRARPMLERLAALNPATLACMHGSAWRGDGGGLLRALADKLCD